MSRIVLAICARALLVLATLFVTLGSEPALAARTRCGSSADIAIGNAAADRLHAALGLHFPASPDAAPEGYQTIRPTGGDDSEALQAALDRHGRVWLVPGAVYQLHRRLVLSDEMALVGGGAGATLFLRLPDSGDPLPTGAVATHAPSRAAIFGGGAEGLRLTGSNIKLDNLFVVREWREDTYGVAITVHQARNVLLDRLRIRGLALAPGIISLQSVHDATIRRTLIHASCSASMRVPEPASGGDLNAFQITGITVDDIRPQGSSSGVLIEDNVITGLGIDPSSSYRGDQSDGINIHASDFGEHPAVLRNNHISDVAEGIDLFGSGILVTDNVIRASGLGIKLIHGARRITVRGNRIDGEPRLGGIAAYSVRGRYGPERRVGDIRIIDNVFDLGSRAGPAIRIDDRPRFPPLNVTLRDNSIRLPDCNRTAIACATGQCVEAGNSKRGPDGADC